MSGSHLKDLTVALRTQASKGALLEAIELSKKEDFEANWKEIKDELAPSEIKKLLAIAKTKGNDNKKGRKGGKRRLVRDPDAGFIQRQLEAAQRLVKSRQLSSFARGLEVLEKEGRINITAEELLKDIAESVRSPPKTQSKKHSKKKKKQTKKKPPKKKKPRSKDLGFAN